MNARELDTKARILAAAEEEFLARGYDRARTKSIADRAGINKALLHYHFRSKDELFAHIFREKTKELFPRVQASLRAGGSFIDFVCTFVELYTSFLIDNPFLPSYLLQVASNHAELLEHIHIDLPKVFLAAFEAEAQAKRIRPHDGRQFLVSLIGMCVMPFVGRNLVKHVLELDSPAFDALVRARAEELKRYVVLLLTPEPNSIEER